MFMDSNKLRYSQYDVNNAYKSMNIDLIEYLYSTGKKPGDDINIANIACGGGNIKVLMFSFNNGLFPDMEYIVELGSHNWLNVNIVNCLYSSNGYR